MHQENLMVRYIHFALMVDVDIMKFLLEKDKDFDINQMDEVSLSYQYLFSLLETQL